MHVKDNPANPDFDNTPNISQPHIRPIFQLSCLPRINNFHQCEKLPVPARRLEVANRRVEFVTAPRVAESHDVAIVLGQRIGLYRLPGPRADLVDAVGEVKVILRVRLVRNRFLVVQFSVPPDVFHVYV